MLRIRNFEIWFSYLSGQSLILIFLDTTANSTRWKTTRTKYYTTRRLGVFSSGKSGKTEGQVPIIATGGRCNHCQAMGDAPDAAAKCGEGSVLNLLERSGVPTWNSSQHVHGWKLSKTENRNLELTLTTALNAKKSQQHFLKKAPVRPKKIPFDAVSIKVLRKNHISKSHWRRTVYHQWSPDEKYSLTEFRDTFAKKNTPKSLNIKAMN